MPGWSAALPDAPNPSVDSAVFPIAMLEICASARWRIGRSNGLADGIVVQMDCLRRKGKIDPEFIQLAHDREQQRFLHRQRFQDRSGY